MRRVKTVLCLLLSAALLLGGCQKSQNSAELTPENPTSIEIWHYYNGAQKLAFDAIVSEFNDTVGAEKGIVVEAFSQGNVNELAQITLDAAEKKVGAKELPDIVATYADNAKVLDDMGVLAPLDGYITEEELAEYVDGYIEEGRFSEDGALKILPVAKSTEIMMLNKTDWDAFSQATGAQTDALLTMEGLTATAKAYYEWTDAQTPDVAYDGQALFGRDAMANYMLVGYRSLTGKDIFSERNEDGTLKLDEQAIHKLWDNFYLPTVNGWFGAYGRFRSDDAKTGKLIALVGSTSGALYFPDTVTVSDTESYPIETFVMAPPLFEGAENCAVQQGAGMAVIKSDAKQEQAAVAFLQWFTEPERNIEFCVESGYLPVKKAANNMDMIAPVLDEQEQGPSLDILRSVMDTSIGMVNNAVMYAPHPFDGSADARAVLENSMFDQAQNDRASLVAALENGASYEDAIVPYMNADSFSNWYEQFVKDLNAAVQQ